MLPFYMLEVLLKTAAVLSIHNIDTNCPPSALSIAICWFYCTHAWSHSFQWQFIVFHWMQLSNGLILCFTFMAELLWYSSGDKKCIDCPARLPRKAFVTDCEREIWAEGETEWHHLEKEADGFQETATEWVFSCIDCVNDSGLTHCSELFGCLWGWGVK